MGRKAKLSPVLSLHEFHQLLNGRHFILNPMDHFKSYPKSVNGKSIIRLLSATSTHSHSTSKQKHSIYQQYLRWLSPQEILSLQPVSYFFCGWARSQLSHFFMDIKSQSKESSIIKKVDCQKVFLGEAISDRWQRMGHFGPLLCTQNLRMFFSRFKEMAKEKTTPALKHSPGINALAWDYDFL